MRNFGVYFRNKKPQQRIPARSGAVAIAGLHHSKYA